MVGYVECVWNAGGYATVYKGTYKGDAVAIKQLQQTALCASRMNHEDFRHEVWIMR
jgi:hypothetical protein